MTAALDRNTQAAPAPDLGTFLDRTLRSTPAAAGTVVVTMPVHATRLDAILSTELEDEAFLWEPVEGPAFSGFGAAHSLEAKGFERFASIRAQSRAIWDATARIDHPSLELRAAVPRMIGGFSFEDDLESAMWAEFGAASFTLPRWTLSRSNTRAQLALAIRGDDARSRSPRARAVEELAMLLDRIARAEHEVFDVEAVSPAATAMTKPTAEGWAREIDAIQAAIASGEVEKIVPSRRTWIVLPEPIEHRRVLARLGAMHRDVNATRYMFHRGRSTFLGLTPERLLAKRGVELRTEALAGTAPIGSAAELASAKNGDEHAIVARYVAERLSAAGAEVAPVRMPEIRRVGHIAHLATPIVARAADDAHLLELARVLHPTPSVAGSPTEAALRFLARHEPEARGWYAGAIGWFDARGDGELSVALRCALLRDRAALLFAGVGVVAQSRAADEYREARLKEHTMRAAIGAPGTLGEGERS